MAYNLSNKCAKNCCSRTILVQFIVEDVVTFFGTPCNSFNIYRKYLHVIQSNF